MQKPTRGRFQHSHVAAILAFGLSVAVSRSGGAQAAPWWPPAGAVILSGGGLAGATSDSLVSRIIALAGGPDAHIVVIPTANPRADTIALRRTFESRGAHHVVVIDTHDCAEAN